MVNNMENKSIWSKTKIKKNYPKLDKDINTDILIIGGGITGINILYKLKDFNVTLVERNKLCQATTLNTTGKLTFMQDNIYNNIIKIHNEKKASLYLKSQLEAIDIIKKIIKDNNINCDFIKTKSYIFTNKKSDIEKLKTLKEFLIKNNIEVNEEQLTLVNNLYSISSNNTYLFNPIKYVNGLLNNLNNDIYENTNIIDIKYEDNKYICSTKDNKITAKYVILACHYPNFVYPYFFPLKSHIEKSYIVAYKNKINNISLISYDNPVLSIRNYQDYTLKVSNSHILCNDTNDLTNFEELVKDVKKDNLYLWSNTDIYTSDYLPYIGYIKDNLLIATGFNTWGMLNSVISGKVIADLIKQKYNEYQELFDPKRVKSKLKMINDSFYSLKGYIKGYQKNDKIKYSKINGEDVMIYKDHIVKRTCPHLKCKLLFNEIEETFDCPCHSSKFDLDGKIINGPSKYNINTDNN